VRYTKRERELQAKKKVYQQAKKNKRKQNDEALISSYVCTGGKHVRTRVCVSYRERDRMLDVYIEQKKREATVQKTCAKNFYFFLSVSNSRSCIFCFFTV